MLAKLLSAKTDEVRVTIAAVVVLLTSLLVAALGSARVVIVLMLFFGVFDFKGMIIEGLLPASVEDIAIFRGVDVYAVLYVILLGILIVKTRFLHSVGWLLRHWFGKWFALFLVFCFVNTSPSTDVVTNVRGALVVAFPVAVFVCIIGARFPLDERLCILRWFVIFVFAACVVMLLVWIAFGANIYFEGSNRVLGTGGKNAFPLLVAIALLVCLALVHLKGQSPMFSRPVYALMIGVFILAIGASGTRIAVAGVMAGTMTTLLLLGYPLRLTLVLVAELSAVVISGTLPRMLEAGIDFDPTLTSAASVGFALSEGVLQDRVFTWSAIMEELFEGGVFWGGGFGSSAPFITEFRGGTVGSAHSEYVRFLSELGIVGGSVFVLWWIATFRLLLDRFRVYGREGNTFAAHLTVGSVAAFVVVLVGAITDNTFYYYYNVCVPAWVAFALSVADRVGVNPSKAQTGIQKAVDTSAPRGPSGCPSPAASARRGAQGESRAAKPPSLRGNP